MTQQPEFTPRRGSVSSHYEAPKDTGKRWAAPWGHIAGYGLLAAVVGGCAILVTATFSYMPANHPFLFTAHMAVVVAALLAVVGGLAAAVIAGIGYALSK